MKRKEEGRKERKDPSIRRNGQIYNWSEGFQHICQFFIGLRRKKFAKMHKL